MVQVWISLCWRSFLHHLLSQICLSTLYNQSLHLYLLTNLHLSAQEDHPIDHDDGSVTSYETYSQQSHKKKHHSHHRCHRDPLAPLENMARSVRGKRGGRGGKQKAPARKQPLRAKKICQEEEDKFSEPEVEDEETLEVDEEPETQDLDPKDKEIGKLKAELAASKTAQATKPISLTELMSTEPGRDYYSTLNKSLQRNWWGKQPFVNKEISLTKLCANIYLEQQPKEHKNLETEEAKAEAKALWITRYRKVIRSICNSNRNYFQGQLRKAWIAHVHAEINKIPKTELMELVGKKDKDGNEVHLVTAEGHPTPKYILTKMDTVIDAEEIFLVATRDHKFLDTERGKFVFDWYWNCALPAIAGDNHWSESIRLHKTISEAQHAASLCQPNGFACIPIQLEALSVLFFENAYSKWTVFASEKYRDTNWMHKEDAPYMVCKYSTSKKGGRTWGAFGVEGQNRWAAIKDVVKTGRQESTTKEHENQCLTRLQIEARLEGPMKKESKKRKRKQDPLETVPQDEDDLF